MKDLLSVTPHIPSQNMDETVTFLVEVLGFDILHKSAVYSEVSSDNNTIGVQASEGEPNQQSIYLRVKDVDALWDRIKDKTDAFHCKRPFDRDYGMREIHVVIPASATLLFIGSAIV